MANDGSGGSPIRLGSFQLEPMQLAMGFGAALIGAGALLALDELIDGHSYWLWRALIFFTEAASVGVLVLLAARRLGNVAWSGELLRAAPAIGAGLIAASVALTVRDATDDFDIWVVLNDLFFWIPLTLGAVIYLSGEDRQDRLFGSPSEIGRGLAIVALVIGLLISINDFSDASRNELWIFLDSLVITAGFALLLLAVSQEPEESRRALERGSFNPRDALNDPRAADVIAAGAVVIVGVGVLLGLKALSDGGDNAFWHFLQIVGFKLGLGVSVLIASGGKVGSYFDGSHPYIRYALVAAIGAMLLAGLVLTLDASNNQFWRLLDNMIVDLSFVGLALVMYEATAAMRRA